MHKMMKWPFKCQRPTTKKRALVWTVAAIVRNKLKLTQNNSYSVTDRLASKTLTTCTVDIVKVTIILLKLFKTTSSG